MQKQQLQLKALNQENKDIWINKQQTALYERL
jgi:hypothetical protein